MNIYKNMLRHAGLMGDLPRNAPELNGFGSFAGAGGGAGSDDDDTGGGQQSQLVGVNEDDTDPMTDLLSAFGDPDDDDSDENFSDLEQGDDDGEGEIPEEEVTALQQRIQQSISRMTIGENAIPEDFDPNDRGQLTTLLNSVVRAAVAQSMGVVFEPTKMALKQMKQQMTGQIKSQINAASDGMKAQSIMESTVPEINNPKYKTMIQSLDQTLKNKGKKPAERAKAIRKMLNQMGINEPGNNGGGNNRRSSGGGNNGGGVRTGTAALDSFFGKFKAPK